MNLFKLLRRRTEDTAALLARSSGWREAKHFLDILKMNRKFCTRIVDRDKTRLTYLSDTHGAQYVQKYERALRVIVAREISVRQTLYPADGNER